MKQGYSGSTLRRKHKIVEKVSSDETFVNSSERQRDLIALSQHLRILPRIFSIEQNTIFMEFVPGQEGITVDNAGRVGNALRLLLSQSGYAHPCVTGVRWLIELANDNLALAGDSRRISLDAVDAYPSDGLIHSEPGQLIEKEDGSLVFIDIEGIGTGSRYQDLGFILYISRMGETSAIFEQFLIGYCSVSFAIETSLISQMAGIIALAYAGFGLTYVGREEFEKRMQLGISLLARSRYLEG